MFGRRKKAAQTPPKDAGEGGGGPVRLSLAEVYELSYAAFQARGFPDPGVGVSADSICWLEARGLPGMVPMIAELTAEGRPMWNARSPKPDAQNRMVFDCPFVAGPFLEDVIDQLIDPDPEQIRGIQGPTSPILLLPRMATHAARLGEPVEMYFKIGDPEGFGARIVTDGDRVLAEGDARVMLFAHGISLSRLGGPMPAEATGAVRDETRLDASWLDTLADFIAREETDARPS